MFHWFKKGDDGDETPKKLKKIESFEVITLHLSGMRETCEYEIVCKGDRSTVTRYMIRYSDGEQRVPDGEVEVDTAEVLSILDACGMAKWNGFHGAHPRGVKDGTMFRLNATVNGGVSLTAGGSQNFPRHYHEFTDWLYQTIRGAEK